jgi:hypothetical protein
VQVVEALLDGGAVGEQLIEPREAALADGPV